MDVLAIVLCAWLVGGAAILGFGLLLWRPEGRHAADPRDYFDAFWLGLAATVACAQIWHLWYPMNAAFGVVVACLGLVGLLSTGVWQKFATIIRCYRSVAVAFVVGAVWLGLMELRPLELYDAGLYHLQAILWNSSYPTVPGLGNLHGRLAFYTSYFLLQSVFNQGPITGESFRVVAGLLGLVFLAQLAVSGARAVHAVFRRAGSESVLPSDWLLTLMALPALITIGIEGLSTTSTDLPLFPLEVLTIFYVFRWRETRFLTRGVRYVGLALVLAALATTFKLSALVFAVGCLGFVVLMLIFDWRPGSSRLPVRAPLVIGAAVTCVLVAGMLINSTVLSGYPLYPSTVIGLPVDWRVPEIHAQFDSQGIGFTARQPGKLSAQTFAGLAWLPPWLAANAGVLAAPVIGVVLGVAALYCIWTRGPQWTRHTSLVVLPVYGAIVFWFATAPAPRFAGALIWLAGVIPLAQLCAIKGSRLARVLPCTFVLLAFLPTQAVGLSLVARQPVAAIRRGLSPVPVVPMDVFVTNSGVQLFVPHGAEDAWAGPIPSTPYPDPDLRARCADNLACGFDTDSGWWSQRALES